MQLKVFTFPTVAESSTRETVYSLNTLCLSKNNFYLIFFDFFPWVSYKINDRCQKDTVRCEKEGIEIIVPFESDGIKIY